MRGVLLSVSFLAVALGQDCRLPFHFEAATGEQRVTLPNTARACSSWAVQLVTARKNGTVFPFGAPAATAIIRVEGDDGVVIVPPMVDQGMGVGTGNPSKVSVVAQAYGAVDGVLVGYIPSPASIQAATNSRYQFAPQGTRVAIGTADFSFVFRPAGGEIPLYADVLLIPASCPAPEKVAVSTLPADTGSCYGNAGRVRVDMSASAWKVYPNDLNSIGSAIGTVGNLNFWPNAGAITSGTGLRGFLGTFSNLAAGIVGGAIQGTLRLQTGSQSATLGTINVWMGGGYAAAGTSTATDDVRGGVYWVKVGTIAFN